MGFDVRKRLSKLRSSAKARGIAVNLDVNKYQNLIELGCHYCGSDLSNEKGYCLDRVDSNKGYILTNVVPCCKICNIAKNNMDIWQFANWLERAYKHTSKTIEQVKLLIENGQVFSIQDEVNVHDELSQNKPKLRIKEYYKSI